MKLSQLEKERSDLYQEKGYLELKIKTLNAQISDIKMEQNKKGIGKRIKANTGKFFSTNSTKG